MLPPQFGTYNVTQSVVVDTSGHDLLNFSLILGTHSTAADAYGTIKWSESDTSTDVTSMTDIVALTGGTSVVSGSTGWVIPPSTSAGLGTVVEFNIDLRKRKKYIALLITGGTLNGAINGRGIVCGVGHLLRSTESDDTAPQKSANTRYDNTAASACTTVVNV